VALDFLSDCMHFVYFVLCGLLLGFGVDWGGASKVQLPQEGYWIIDIFLRLVVTEYFSFLLENWVGRFVLAGVILWMR
jgi:hypothetical protein